MSQIDEFHGYPLDRKYAAAHDAFRKEAKHEMACEINCIIAACDAYEAAKGEQQPVQVTGAVEPYKAFFDALWRAYCDQELQLEDAEFVITAACKNGLAKEERYDPDVHGEALGDEWGLEKGDSCYVLAKPTKREFSKHRTGSPSEDEIANIISKTVACATCDSEEIHGQFYAAEAIRNLCFSVEPTPTGTAMSAEVFKELGMSEANARRAERGINAVLRREQIKHDNVPTGKGDGE